MKNIIIIIALTISFASCTKDNNNEKFEALNGDIYERPIENENKSNR